MVSVTISLPSRGAFHLSLTVLVRYRSERIFRLIPLDGTDFHRVSCPVILGIPLDWISNFKYWTVTIYGQPFQTVLLSKIHTTLRSRNPRAQRERYQDFKILVTSHSNPIFLSSFVLRTSLAFSLFARRYWGNHVNFLFLSLLRCFSSGGTLSNVMYWRLNNST